MTTIEQRELTELKKSLGKYVATLNITKADEYTHKYVPMLKKVLSENGYTCYNHYRLDENTVEIYGCSLAEVQSIFLLGIR